MVVDDRFTATNLNPVLARPGQHLSLAPQVERPLERRLHLDCCQSVIHLLMRLCSKCGEKHWLNAAPSQGSAFRH